MPFIIDGYNLLHFIHKSDEDFEEITDVALCHILDKFLKLSRDRGQIVFDGIGPPDKSGFDNIANLEVIFSGRDIEADAVIENKISANTAPKRLNVVSSDRRLRRAAQLRKAIALKCDVFWRNVQKQFSRKRGIAEPRQKRAGLTEAETKQWMEFFDLEE